MNERKNIIPAFPGLKNGLTAFMCLCIHTIKYKTMEVAPESICMIAAYIQARYPVVRELRPYEFYLIMMLSYWSKGEWFYPVNYAPCHYGNKRTYQQIVIRIANKGFIEHEKGKKYYRIAPKGMMLYNDMVRRAGELYDTFSTVKNPKTYKTREKRKTKKIVPKKSIAQVLATTEAPKKTTNILSKLL